MAGHDDKEGAIPTNLRLLLVLETLADAGIPLTPTEVNHKLGLPKPTIHRLFATLEGEGFIRREIDGRGYSPAHRLRKLSTGILSSLQIGTARNVILKKLAEEIGETCNVSLPDRDEMVYLDRVETKWPLRIQLPVGTRVPFYCTASGKMYLSGLDRRQLRNYAYSVALDTKTPRTISSPDALIEEVLNVRKLGYSIDNGEFMEGMIAVAVAIRDSNGRMLSTLSFHAPEQRLPLQSAVRHVQKLKNAATKLTNLMTTTDTEIS